MKTFQTFLYLFVLLLLLSLSTVTFAQTPTTATAPGSPRPFFTTSAVALPDHFTGAGAGFQNSAIPRTSGWFTTCVQALARTYTCLASDYSSGGTTSTRADVHVFAAAAGPCAFFGKAGPGAATGATGGVGGSFDAGGLVACKIPEKLLRTAGLVGVFSGSWNKRNVVESPDLGTAFHTFGAQTIWRFGVGKSW